MVPEAWQKVIADKRRPGKLVRRHFEICVFTCLADELVRGDVTAVGSEAYANWQSQPLSWQDCQPHLATYCAEIGLPTTASEFAAQLKTRIKNVAATVDAGYPDNAGLLIDEQGRPSLKARKSAGHSPEALKLAGAQVCSRRRKRPAGSALAEEWEDPFNAVAMRLGVPIGYGVRHQRDVVAVFVGGAGGGLHADAGGDPGQHDLCHVAAA